MTGKEKEPALTRRPAPTPVSSGQTLAAGNDGVNACIVPLPEITRESTADITESADGKVNCPDCGLTYPDRSYVCEQCHDDVVLCGECHLIVSPCGCGHCPAHVGFVESAA